MRLGLSGHARNLADGRVEVLASGDAAGIDELGRWLQRGPPHARVNAVQQDEVEVAPETDFRVL